MDSATEQTDGVIAENEVVMQQIKEYDANVSASADVSSDEDDGEPGTPPRESNGHPHELEGKRMRKQVQRLSESLSKAHEDKVEQRAKAAKELFESGSGTALGDIPRIEATLRKIQPISLKPFHLIVYGRFGTLAEIRSNLRKFRGFPFKPGTPEYDKKLAQIEQRPLNEVREVLRILSLEVSGSREVIAARLLDFLLKPSADKVKYKGQVTSGRKSLKKKVDKKAKRKSGSRKSATKTASSEGSTKQVSQTDDDDELSESSENVSSADEQSSGEEYSSAEKKPALSKTKNCTKRTPKRRVSLDESDSEPSVKEPSSLKRKISPVKTTTADSDEDAPLSVLSGPKKSVPSEPELKENIIALLKTVNLEETSLRVVREKIFARYPGIDLTDKKDFINTTVKEYLAQS